MQYYSYFVLKILIILFKEVFMKKKRIFLILLDGRKSELIIKKWGKLNKLFKYSHLKIKINSIKIIIKYKKPFFI